MKATILLMLALACRPTTQTRTFNRCSLARELHALGVPKSELPQWTCIAQRESSYRTDAVGPPNSDGSRDYGIFQINDRYWCQPAGGKFSHNSCQVSCNALLTDNIRRSVECARQVKRQQGWTAWSVWHYCSGSLPSINSCF